MYVAFAEKVVGRNFAPSLNECFFFVAGSLHVILIRHLGQIQALCLLLRPSYCIRLVDDAGLEMLVFLAWSGFRVRISTR